MKNENNIKNFKNIIVIYYFIIIHNIIFIYIQFLFVA